MADPAIQRPPQRPTIVLGYGAFGLDVLRRLLASTALRGVLVWSEPADGAGPGERRLQDLALLWVPDRLGLEGQAADEESGREGSSLEMMRDLYRQIHRVEEHSSVEEDVAREMVVAVERLLSASRRAALPDKLPLGLDVVVLARPTVPQVIGLLERMLAPAMGRLANNANLQRGFSGTPALNFIQILDFENYWDRGETGRRVRQAVADAVEQGHRRRRAGQPAFGRRYLVDGRTRDGIRDESHRVDEVSLFLEFLLFEGQRGGELQRLYQPQVVDESPVATFGIRLMEHSAGLLSRLAAAHFAIGWLDYLADDEPAATAPEPPPLRQLLAGYTPAKLDQMVGAEEMRLLLRQELEDLERELTALSTQAPDWPGQVRERYQTRALAFQERLAEETRRRMREIRTRSLAPLPEELEAAVEADLHHSRYPRPLGALIREVDEALDRLESRREATLPRAGEVEAALGALEALHADYGRFRSASINVEHLRRWWPLFALATATALTPLVLDLLGDIPPPDPVDHLLTLGYGFLQRWIANPPVVSLLLFLALWGLGTGAMQPRVAARSERARRFFEDPDRGRFADRLRADLAPGGALSRPLERYLERLIEDMVLSVRGEVSRELGRVAARLKERRREMAWLRRQLQEFLKVHGLGFDEQRPRSEAVRRNGTGIRYSVEKSDDFESVLNTNPARLERFFSTQATARPFAHWQERFGRTFLYPLHFVDGLSETFRDPFLEELSRPDAGPEQRERVQEFLAFLRHRGTFDLAFSWKQQDGLPPDQRYCLLPALWRRLGGISQALADLRMGEEGVLVGTDVARAYLLRLQTGVDKSCLLAAEDP